MEIKKYEIGNAVYEFVNEYWETRYSWGHKTVLFRNNIELSHNKVRYYNRTWERFRYQTCMLGAISNEMKWAMNRRLEDYKADKGISRFRKGEKEIVIENVKKENDYYKELAELYQKVENY
jgi:hypothetical protein